MKTSNAMEEKSASHCCDCGSSRLPECSKVRNRAEKCHDKRPSRHSGPHTVPANQNRSKCNAVSGPHRPKITAPDVRGRLAEFARDHIGEKDKQNLEEVAFGDALLEGPEGANYGAVPALVLHRITRSHACRLALVI